MMMKKINIQQKYGPNHLCSMICEYFKKTHTKIHTKVIIKVIPIYHLPRRRKNDELYALIKNN